MKKILLLVAVLMFVALPAFAQPVGFGAFGGGNGSISGSAMSFGNGSSDVKAGVASWATAGIISPTTGAGGSATIPLGDGDSIVLGPNSAFSGTIVSTDTTTISNAGVTETTDTTIGGGLGISTHGTQGYADTATTGKAFGSSTFDGGSGAHVFGTGF